MFAHSTSPSVYIAIPTIAAYDDCGQVGSVHTSTTLAFDPGELSTILRPRSSLDSSSFNLADAWCLPSATSGEHLLSVTGNRGLYPFVDFLPGLSLIDPVWNTANCFVDNHQWILPPYALESASNILFSTTSIDPTATTMPASPSFYTSIPMETNPMTPVTASWPVQTASYPLDDPHSSSIYLSTIRSSSNSPVSQYTINQSTDSVPAPVTISEGVEGPSSINGNTRVPLASSKPFSQPPTLISQTITTQSATVRLIGSQPPFPESIDSIDSVALPLAVSASYVLTIITTVPIEGPMAPSDSAAIVFEGHTYTANSLSAFVVNSQTLTHGGMISIGSIVLSLPISASFVVEGTLGTSIPSGNPEVFTFAGQPYTANSASDFTVDGKTLAPGSVITISGTPIALAATPTNVVIGTSTQGLGALIVQGIGGASQSTPTIFVGRASSIKPGMRWVLVFSIALGLYGRHN